MTRSQTDAVQGLKSSGVSLQQLRLFVILAQHRSFTQAGNALGVTQSAASRSIRELEDLLELRLFDRTTRQVALTDTGRALLPRIALLVDELEAALRFGRQVSTVGKRHGVDSQQFQPGRFGAPALLSSCRASYPNIALTLHDAPQGRVLELVRAGDADMGVLTGPPDISDPDDLCDLSTETLVLRSCLRDRAGAACAGIACHGAMARPERRESVPSRRRRRQFRCHRACAR